VSMQRVCRSIKKFDNFLITAHVNPEGDALGAAIGFYHLVKQLGKQASIVIDDLLPYGYDFLPQLRLIRRFGHALGRVKFDCLAVLDCADLARAGRVHKLKKSQPVLNIDHHISNQNFGDVNWVDPQASSCSEMIYALYKKLRVPFNHNAALALYTGIMTDTGSFRYTNTSSLTFLAAAELVKFGVDVAGVYRYAYENIPRQAIRLLLQAQSGVKFFKGGKVAVFTLGSASVDKNSGFDLADQVLNFGRQIKGVEVVALFKPLARARSQVRVNLRSQGKVDVNQVARHFSGGGHKTAAGCTLKGSLASIQGKVIAEISRKFK